MPDASKDRGGLRVWSELLFPLGLATGEYIMCQRYWKPDWPAPAPDGRTSWRPQRFKSVDDLCRELPTLGRAFNLGVAFATVSDGTGRRAGAFLRGYALGADLDCGEGKPFASMEAALAAVDGFEATTGFSPGLVLNSGSGVQAHYLLETPTEDGHRFENVLTRLIFALGADKGAQGRLRVLRAPGTLNFKYNPPREVTLLKADNIRYTIDQFEAVLPALARPSAGPVRGADPKVNKGRVLPVTHPELRRLLGGAMPERYHGDESSRDFFVAMALLENGASPDDVLATMCVSELGRQAKRKHDALEYLTRTVTNAAEKLASNRTQPSRPPSRSSSRTARPRRAGAKR